jgi:hypothetical protein
MRCLVRFLAPVACALGLSTAAAAKSLEAVSDDLTHFYEAPTAARFAALQADVETHKAALGPSIGNPGLLISVAFARIAAKHGWQLRDGAYAVTASEILDGRTAVAKYVADDKAVDAAKLDIWWASYFATGETVYLEKIAAQAKASPGDDRMRVAVVAAARWSLASNCRMHPSIAAYLKSRGEPGC